MESMRLLYLVNNTKEKILNGDNVSHDVASQHVDVMMPLPFGGHVGRKE